MLKYAMLAGAMTVAAPALAQVAATPAQTADTQATTAAPSATTSPGPATSAASTQATPTAAAPATDTAAAAKPANAADQVAQVVETEFPTYDKDGNGSLSKAEFASWMVTLKTASDPSTKATSPATTKWVAGAFVQADKDKTASISKTELTGFLSQGQS